MNWNFLFGIVAGAALGAGFYALIKFFRRKLVSRSLERTLFLIRVPRGASKAGNDPRRGDIKTEIGTTEQLLANLSGLKAPITFEVVVPHVGEEIHFFLAVPKRYAEVAAKQVQGLWSGASVEPAGDDFNIFNPQGATMAAYLTQQEPFALPIRTYAEMDSDTFSSVVGAFAKINEIGEGAALQVVLRPAPGAKKSIMKQIESLRKGESLGKISGSGFGFSEIKKALAPESKADEEGKKAEQRALVDDDAVKALTAKVAKPLFSVNVRLVASAPSPFQANDILDGLTAGFAQFGAPRRNEFRVVKPKNTKSLVYDFAFRNFDAGKAMTLSTEEVASFFHLPTSSTETPRVKWLKSKEASPPPNLPTEGTKLGESLFRGERRPVYITDEDRRRHIYVIGQTGTGKSTLLGNMIIQDVTRSRGFAILDPHGELIETVLRFVPDHRADDVIVFDPGDLMHPMGLNMLDYNPERPEEKTFIVNEMQSIFNKLFPPESMGPMFEQYMRNALLLLMEDMPNEPATLIEVPRVFTDVEFRKRKLDRIRNPVVVDFWTKEASKAGGEASLANMTPYITSKFNNFIANDYMRPIIGQPKSAFNFRAVMDEGKILLVNLPKGRIGDLNAGLLGMIVVGKLLMAALSRIDIDARSRRDFSLYIDEFQNFTTDSIATIFSEARKYGLNLTVAHQFVAQLTEKIRDAVFGNVGSMIAARVGAPDADFLVKQFAPVFDENDLVNIDNLNAYVRILIRGETSRPFNIKFGTESWVKGDEGREEAIRDRSRTRYGAERQAVEDDIYRRLRT